MKGLRGAALWERPLGAGRQQENVSQQCALAVEVANSILSCAPAL